MIQACRMKSIPIKETKDYRGNPNGNILEVFNILQVALNQEQEIRNVYITQCLPGSIKGPHLHAPPKVDRFILLQGDAKIKTRNEETRRIQEWSMYPMTSVLIIPPGNSHMIESETGCSVLNLCSEAYDPSQPYNQVEVTW
jgi:dTDP-4-dehydrorhamnose 3,5-epimerase-like enzyme